ncbi:MAG: TonB-dependent receptor plug domain-containing protein, partial [Flavobacteriales bacterium]|nr:TonB-dependent receptor plug domain-containing protein [Flavobacteriales bacterium]
MKTLLQLFINRRALIILSSFLIQSNFLFAQEKLDSLDLAMEELQLNEVVITATRASHKTPIAFTNITKKDINDRNLGQDIPILMELTPSFVSTSDGGTGVGYTNMRIRGSDNTRINVTMNGIPMNDAESHGVWWVNMPDLASSLEDIQVQRGVGTSTNGAGAFGASINLRTNTLNKDPYAELNGTYGSFNTQKYNIKGGSGLLAGKFAVDARAS